MRLLSKGLSLRFRQTPPLVSKSLMVFLKSFTMQSAPMLRICWLFGLHCSLVLFAFGQPKPMENTNGNPYKSEWKTIDSLQEEGLYQSALERVNLLFSEVSRENLPDQIVKCLIYQTGMIQTLEEDGQAKAILQLQNTLPSLPFPANAIAQSFLGEQYFSYLDNFRYQIQQRTTIADFKPNDLQTWSIAQLEAESSWLYLKSLQYDGLEKIAIQRFDLITTKAVLSDDLRPTLYDFLAHRAVDRFSNDRGYLTRPSYRFQLDQPEAFAPAEAFARFEFTTRDTAAFHHRAVLIFQQLLRLRQPPNHLGAFLDADLKRLQFAKAHSTLPDKSTRYKAALERNIQQWPDNAITADYRHALAEWYVEFGQGWSASLPYPSPEEKTQDEALEEEAKKWAWKTALQLCNEAITLHPGTPGADKCALVRHQILTKNLRLETEEVAIPGKPVLVALSYQNVQSAYVKVVRIPWEEMRRLNNQNAETSLKWLQSMQPVQEIRVSLQNPGDYRAHSTEIALDPLEPGLYALIIADNPRFKTENHTAGFAILQVSQLAWMHRSTPDGVMEFFLTDRFTGAPVKGVKAEFYEVTYRWDKEEKATYRKRGEAISDENGYLKDTNAGDRNSFEVLFSLGEDRLSSQSNLSAYRYFRNRDPERFTQFFLDRSIYRPGQTVYFKALLLEKNEKGIPRILPNEKVTITFRDANYQETARREFRSNAYGSINGSFQAPETGLRGRMTLTSSIGSSSHAFSVEAYKRPRFEVVMLPLDQKAALGDSIVMKGKATTYAGSPVDGAQVQYRVVRQMYFPWRWWWYDSGTSSSEMEIAAGTATTNAQGEFSVSFVAADDPVKSRNHIPAFRFTVFADVTDLNGETRSGEKSIQLSKQSLLLSLDIPEEVDRSAPPRVRIQTQNLDGQAIPANGIITLERLKAPERTMVSRLWSVPDLPVLSQDMFLQKFPYLPWTYEDRRENWPVEALVRTDTFDTGLSAFYDASFRALPVGTYLLTLSCKEASGSIITSRHWFEVYDGATGAVGPNKIFWTAPLKLEYQPGDTLKLSMAATDGTTYVLLESDQDFHPLAQPLWQKTGNWNTWERPVTESERGGFVIHSTAVRFNRFFVRQHFIRVPWQNKDLQVTYSTFRDKLLPGQEEEWRITLKGATGDLVAAEMVAAMYDASLDAFTPHDWGKPNFPVYQQSYLQLQPGLFASNTGIMLQNNWNKMPKSGKVRIYRELVSAFPSYFVGFGKRRNLMSMEKMVAREDREEMVMMAAAPPPMAEAATDPNAQDTIQGIIGIDKKDAAPLPPAPRTNLKETVFFFPELATDSSGHITLRFTMNEALTRWKFMGFAHTTDLQMANLQREVVTQKTLMVLPNAPRFVREGDAITFSAKVSSLHSESLSGTARLELFDALTMQPVDALLGNLTPEIPFHTAAGQSAPLYWNLRIPTGKVMVLTHRVTVMAGNFSDAEENTIPVLSNRMMVTETMPMSVRGGKSSNFNFKRMREVQSPTLQHHSFTLEFTSNPAWYAVQALPYLMEYPHECAEQILNRFYANALAASVANSQPRIQKVFETWKGTDAMKSNLFKNQELKNALLEETPWVLSAQSETEQRRNIALLFDLQQMAQSQKKAIAQLAQMQQPGGGFPWFAGGRESWYITQYIVEGLGHLRRLGALDNNTSPTAMDIAGKAIAFTDRELVKAYQELERQVKEGRAKWEDDHLSYLFIHYLYVRSFFPEIPLAPDVVRARNYFLEQANTYWLKKGIYAQGMLALALHRQGTDKTVQRILSSLRERALRSEEMGMHWKYDRGYFWYEMPVETHALMIEVFAEAAQDMATVEELRLWLLKNKQTTHWKTTKATASAVYALLAFGDNWLAEDKSVDVSFGDASLKKNQVRIAEAQATAQAGTGYFKASWHGEEIQSNMGDIKVKNPNKVVSWGSAYWQYFEELDKITTFEETPLTLKRQLFREELSDTGPVLRSLDSSRKLRPGDKVVARVELRVDRDMEYVHLKDMRAGGFEPINVISRYRWQDGLGYYESTGDVATHFFFDYLPRGTYVFEYPMWVSHAGDFSNGISTIQCMYAPEFSSHSQGERFEVER